MITFEIRHPCSNNDGKIMARTLEINHQELVFVNHLRLFWRRECIIYFAGQSLKKDLVNQQKVSNDRKKFCYYQLGHVLKRSDTWKIEKQSGEKNIFLQVRPKKSLAPSLLPSPSTERSIHRLSFRRLSIHMSFIYKSMISHLNIFISATKEELNWRSVKRPSVSWPYTFKK